MGRAQCAAGSRPPLQLSYRRRLGTRHVGSDVGGRRTSEPGLRQDVGRRSASACRRATGDLGRRRRRRCGGDGGGGDGKSGRVREALVLRGGPLCRAQEEVLRGGRPSYGVSMLSLAGRERHARMKLKKYRNSSLARNGRLEHFGYCSSSGERRRCAGRGLCGWVSFVFLFGLSLCARDA